MNKTEVYKVDHENPDTESIRVAAETLRGGRLVAFPTETVYGLGANALDADAIERIYAAKQRPASDPIIAHIYDVAQLDDLAVDVPDAARKLAEAFWPGPLTMVLKRAANVPANIAAGLDTVAVRMPAHPVARALLKAAQIPIAAPSANTFTRPSATTAAHVLEDLSGRVDVVLDGGPTTIGLESTVIDMVQTPPVILRPGGVILQEIKVLLPEVEMNPKYLNTDESSASPGQMMKHYSPRARVLLFDGEADAVLVAMCDTAQRLIANQKRVGILTLDSEAEQFTKLGARIISLGTQEDLPGIGRRLFGAMRALDTQNMDVILVHSFDKDGLGAAIWDRLLRAAEGQVIKIEA